MIPHFLIYIFFISVISFSASASGQPSDKANRLRDSESRVFTEKWAVRLKPGEKPHGLYREMDAQDIDTIGYLDRTYLFLFPGSHMKDLSDTIEKRLKNDKRVEWYQQQVSRWRFLRTVSFTPNFSDPMFNDQWHLNNTGQRGGTPGVDIHILPAWEKGLSGYGIVIGIVDDGLEYNHPDVALNYRREFSYDFNDHDADPIAQRWDTHGTSVAGLAAARDEETCGVGVAYRSGLAALRLVSRIATDAEEAQALSYRRNDIHIYSSSWGPDDFGTDIDGPDQLTRDALKDNVLNGRNGLGNIYVWACGNGATRNDNINYDGYANSRYTIAVGSVDEYGVRSYYSEAGTPLVTMTPSDGGDTGITTTDLVGRYGTSSGDCTRDFGGTSASAPILSGIVALMLEANTNLTWRDVQHILIRSSEQTNPSDPDWIINGAGYFVNHKYGFGLIDAEKAVNLASDWIRKPDEIRLRYTPMKEPTSIPDNNTTGVRSTVKIEEKIQVEHVEVVFYATHPYRGDLRIVLTSPSGTQSILAEKHSDSHANYNGWIFMTVRNWDEISTGEWHLDVSDLTYSNTGSLDSYELILYGTPTDLSLAIMILKMISGVPWKENFSITDVDHDGFIGMEEAIYYLQKSVNIR